MELYQHTVKKKVSFRGIGLHSGEPVTLTVNPAPANSGIRFSRTDISLRATLPAFMTRVVDTQLATTLASDEFVVSTTEHMLAALSGLGIDNALIELDGNEVPIMDGSAGPFVHILKRCGRRRQKACKQMLKITDELLYQDGDKSIRVLPYDGLRITCNIDFNHEFLKRQSYSIELSPEKFMKEIASARTFGFMGQVEKLRENGLALGGSLENAIVIDQYGVLNKEGLRFADEFVRHKILDLIGDLALLGCPLVGHVIASKTGHSQHLGFMKKLARHPDCWEFVKLEKNGDHTVLDKMITTTKAASNIIMPFLLPPAIAGEACPA
ncbi:MAG: UDP-3-O-acyl-N-acetylglucosamine deacetylase [Proteobacteria bacterium]|nr:UDP-3-O-acyl-N-acetylglucosamine deacetylase [Pseudomonadota bacterium]MBU1709807.1 UDP-3-O-acyl-N-acetylglucosamine deacetylase [Pseudomonadota bacterium]